MAKRKRTQTRAVLENRQRQGRGRGEGAAYRPWLFVHDVASRGRSSRIPSAGRVMHTLSDWETAALRDFQWDPAVIEVKEQVPLILEDTLRIAAEMKVRHPADGRPREPIPLSTDFLVKRLVDGRVEQAAYAVKESSAIDMPAVPTRGKLVSIRRTRQKLEIERRYWLERGVSWDLLTEDRLSKVRKGNIEFVLRVRPDPERPDGHWQRAMLAVHAAIADGGPRTLDQLARALDAAGTLDRRDFPTAVRLLCAKHALAFDMDRQFTLSRPASDFVVAPTIRPDEAA
ncbi:TnsA endonuclease N terminal [Sphingomonas palmae]|uniref:TnsA endonuclease N terminal n=1 Tax=Sphingomonas palmae TaxID=1855283 RepID=A0A1H7U1G4_9SPHN|nr:TnsA endonuclease N-terminal domain-containing protein [Sphingomonas palmae]SEL90625.1 TnsA endonuclease N terminal [Sphingomonas palmae]